MSTETSELLRRPKDVDTQFNIGEAFCDTQGDVKDLEATMKWYPKTEEKLISYVG